MSGHPVYRTEIEHTENLFFYLKLYLHRQRISRDWCRWGVCTPAGTGAPCSPPGTGAATAPAIQGTLNSAVVTNRPHF